MNLPVASVAQTTDQTGPARPPATSATRRPRVGAEVLGNGLRAPEAGPATTGPGSALAFTGNGRSGVLVRSALIAIGAGILSLRLGRRGASTASVVADAPASPAVDPPALPAINPGVAADD